MPSVYWSPVKATTHKATLESSHPPYQDQPAAEEAAHTAAGHIEVAHTDTPPNTTADTPS